MSGTAFADAMLAVRLLARDPAGLGGIVLRGDGPARDAVYAELIRLMPVRKLPLTIDDEALIGGRDLAATLAGTGGAVRKGLLAQADGGIVVVPMAERMSDSVAARIAGVMDAGEVVVERDGIGARHPARFGLVLLDDGHDEERAPQRLTERVAFSFDLAGVRESDAGVAKPESEPIAGIERVLASTAMVLGIGSARAPLLAFRAAHGLAAMAGREAPDAVDVAVAARLVFASRATQLPEASTEEEPQPPEPEADTENQPSSTTEPPDDMVLAAVLASLPPDVLAAISAGSARRKSSGSGAGERRKSPMRGRPLGSKAGLPRGGARLSLIDTLRAAAPWQKMRGRQGRVVIARDDVRIKRFETRAEATTIFAVDASGSAAVARLAEAKGAVELLLAEAYIKRAEVALIAFRGSVADVLLPPTRSLTRARRALAELPGGGGTPLAAGIDAARLLADGVRAKGRTPFVVLLSDGRGNVAADGSTVADVAKRDSINSARALGASGTRSVFIDISARPRPDGSSLAEAMRGRYLALPRADAMRVRDAVVAEQAAR